MSEVYIAATWSDGSVSHEAIQLVMRAPKTEKPPVGGWKLRPDGWWEREASDANIFAELVRTEARRTELEGLSLTGWRRLSQEEHDMFGRDREWRDALEDVGGKLQHNMVKARACHRKLLEHQGIEKLLILDGQWNKFNGQNRKADADAVETKRQAIRDVLNDPRIDAATTLDELKRITVEGL